MKWLVFGWGVDGKVKIGGEPVEPKEKRESLLESFPDAIHSLGGWTRLGYVAMDLAALDDGLIEELVTDAWRDAQPRPKKAARRR